MLLLVRTLKSATEILKAGALPPGAGSLAAAAAATGWSVLSPAEVQRMCRDRKGLLSGKPPAAPAAGGGAAAATAAAPAPAPAGACTGAGGGGGTAAGDGGEGPGGDAGTSPASCGGGPAQLTSALSHQGEGKGPSNQGQGQHESQPQQQPQAQGQAQKQMSIFQGLQLMQARSEQQQDSAARGVWEPGAEVPCVFGVVLMPVRSMLMGAFPLNATYFQINEVGGSHV